MHDFVSAAAVQAYSESGIVVKGGVKDPAHQVDAISGATITGKGVDDMLRKGIKYYEPYFMKNKKTDVN